MAMETLENPRNKHFNGKFIDQWGAMFTNSAVVRGEHLICHVGFGTCNTLAFVCYICQDRLHFGGQVLLNKRYIEHLGMTN
jgi:hypothetical protein